MICVTPSHVAYRPTVGRIRQRDKIHQTPSAMADGVHYRGSCMKTRRTRWIATSVVVVAAATMTLAEQGVGSDHQDTPEVELNPRLDMNDVYVFPGSSEDRIVMVMTTQSPISPAGTGAARFDPNALYELKIDNSGDAVED